MPVLKPPPKLIRNATIQVRVEEEVDAKLKKYAEFIDASAAFVVAESLRLLFNKDTEFREWLAQHGDKPAATKPEKPIPNEPAQPRAGMRTTFESTPQGTMSK